MYAYAVTFQWVPHISHRESAYFVSMSKASMSPHERLSETDGLFSLNSFLVVITSAS